MNNFNLSPRIVPLQFALVRYRVALECLDAPKTSLSVEQALEILSARDALQNVLKIQEQVSVDILSQVMQLDLQLKQQAGRILTVLNLPECRESLSITTQQWWWNLETTGEAHPCNRFDWLFKGARSFVWTINLGLLATLATRLLSGGSGLVEIVLIAIPSALTLFQANNELTAKGQEKYNQLLNKLPIKDYLYEEIKLIPPVLILSLLGIVWIYQPKISEYFNKEGYSQQKQGQLINAEQSYLKAIAFDSENLDTNYNLGIFYEDLQDFDNARKYYLIAAKGGLPEAYNNLARLYILQGKYSEAVILLNEEQGVINKLEQEEGEKKKDLPEVKYSLFKNLGWARLRQNDLEEAEGNLNRALRISNDSETKEYIPNPGAVHCLLAQIKAKQAQPKKQQSKIKKRLSQEELKEWQKCQDLIKNKLAAGEGINPEEDTWLSVAKQKLKLANQRGKNS